jgi:hypothetical protein
VNAVLVIHFKTLHVFCCQCLKIIKNIKIALAIIKLFCRAILSKCCVVDVYKFSLLVLLLCRPVMFTVVAVIIFVSNFRDPEYEL